MSREIKFRQWEQKAYSHIIEDGEMWVLHEIKLEDVEQFTGLYDKNNKEIYEGDILRVEGIGNCEVGFFNGAFGLKKGPDYYFFNNDFEKNIEYLILGNVHENSKLLEEDK